MKLTSGLASALIALVPLTSHAVEIANANGVKANLLLQVNRAMMHADDGDSSETFFVDNANSSTRFNFQVDKTLGNGRSLGGQFEAELQSNSSSKVDFDTKSTGDAVLKDRKLQVWLEDKKIGKVFLGQGDGASKGLVVRDLSGTNVINHTSVQLIGGNIRFGRTGPRIGQTINSLNFEGRYDRLRYNSPKIGPVILSASLGTKDESDVTELGLRIKKKLASGVRIDGGVGLSSEDTPAGNVKGTEETVGGSIAVRFKSGFNIAASLSQLSDDNPANPDSDYKSVKVGYATKKHATSLMYAQANDRDVKDDESTVISLGYVYKLDKGADLYAGYKIHSLNRSGSDFDDINILTTGFRLKF